MKNLTDSPTGIKRRLRTIGLTNWSVQSSAIEFQFQIEAIDSEGKIINDKSVNAIRIERYSINNSNKVNSAFNPSPEGIGEYDFFIEFLKKTPFIQAIGLLEDKLIERGYFD
jgi:hypothetical protein